MRFLLINTSANIKTLIIGEDTEMRMKIDICTQKAKINFLYAKRSARVIEK